jgi:hypothetical protein
MDPPLGLKKQLLAQQNSPYFDPATGETNKFRAMMGDWAKKIKPGRNWNSFFIVAHVCDWQLPRYFY